MLKSIARRLFGERHYNFLIWAKRSFGTTSAIRFYLTQVFSGTRDIFCINWQGTKYFFRPGTSDENVFTEIFSSKEYDIDLGNPVFIVDAGANVGFSSVFFAKKYPSATIVALEPELSNFNILLMNTRNFPNIRPMQAGVWSRKTYLCIKDADVGPWAFQVVESESVTDIPAIGIADVLSDFNVANIDVLKMDIEGSEIEVFGENTAWMDHLDTLIVELHDRFRPGCTAALEKLLAGRSYQRSQSGESIIISNLGRPCADQP